MDLTRREFGLDDKEVFRRLGPIGSIVSRNDCALCRCLFGLTPSPDSCDQEVILVLSWSMYRLEASIYTNTKEKRTASRQVSAMLSPSQSQFTIVILSSTRGDGLCIVEENLDRPNTTLGATNVDSDSLDLKFVNNWLSNCERLHPLSCSPSRSKEVEKRQFASTNIASQRSNPMQYMHFWNPSGSGAKRVH